MTEISVEYAEALFALGMEENTKKEYMDALLYVSSVLEKEPEYMEFLASPGVSQSERVKALDEAFGEVLPEHILSFLKLLCERERIRSFPVCVAEYRKLFDESEKTVNAKIISAVALETDEKQKLKEKLEKYVGRSVEMQCNVDSTILGGIVIEIDGKVIDAGLRSRLADVKEVISR